MDLQEDFLNMQIAYEKNCAVRCNCSYEELKAQLDKSESLFGTRYLEGSPRHENWLLWVQAWQAAKAQAVPEEFILVPIKLPEDAIRNLARKRFEEGQEYCTNKFGQFNESNKERWIQDQMGIIKNLYIDFLRTFESL